MLDKPGTKRRFYCGAQLKTYNEVAEKQAQVQEVIASFLRTVKLNRLQQTVDRHDYC